MSKLGKNYVVKLDKSEVTEVNRWLIKVCKEIAIEHFVQNEGMTEKEAISRVQPDGVFLDWEFGDGKITIHGIEIDVFVEESNEVQQKPGNGTETV